VANYTTPSLPLIADLPAPLRFRGRSIHGVVLGYLVSPAHVCLTATVQYPKSRYEEELAAFADTSGLSLLFTLAFWAWQAISNLV